MRLQCFLPSLAVLLGLPGIAGATSITIDFEGLADSAAVSHAR